MKRMAIIGAAFMMAVGSQQAQAQEEQQQTDMGQSQLSQQDVKVQSALRVDQLDKDVPLDLQEDQKNSLIRAMIEYNNAQTALQEEFQEDMSNMEAAFQKTINDILDTDQRESLEGYLKELQQKQEENYKKQMEEAQKQWEAEMKKKAEEAK
jgi:transposase-like protein